VKTFLPSFSIERDGQKALSELNGFGTFKRAQSARKAIKQPFGSQSLTESKVEN
jgi:hypothetical protein